MKKRIVTILCVLAMLLSTFGMVAAAVDTTTVAVIGGTKYTSLQDAVEAVEEGVVGLIELKKNTSETVTVTCDVYVDLAGKNIAGVNVTAGAFYGMDSATDSFAGTGYGKITSTTGNIKAISVDDNCSEQSYLMVKETSGTSFHCVNLELTAMSLRINEVGLYFKSTFGGDALVADNVKSFGIALSAKEEPNKDNIGECELSAFTGFTAGTNNTDATSTLLYGIMKETNPYLVNKRQAATPVYGRAYVKLKNGEYIFGASKNRTLQQQVEAFCRRWDIESSDDKNAVKALYNKFVYVMKPWALQALRNSEYEGVINPQILTSWYNEFTNLPVATIQNLSKEELRQLIVTVARLQLTMPWIPNETFVFETKDKNGSLSTLEKGSVYSGMCYGNANLTNIAENGVKTTYSTVPSGNVYKMLKYYDPKTGVLDIASMGSAEEVFETLSVQCTRGVAWAWARVCSNMQNLKTSSDYTHLNGALRVGPYTYTDTVGGTLNFTEIFENNSAQTMYQSYAAMLPADGLVNDGHMMMCSVSPRVYYENGKIDPYSSYVYIYDQHFHGTWDQYVEDFRSERTVNNTYMRLLGGVKWLFYNAPMLDYTNPAGTMKGQKFTFKDLYDEKYIPFTLAELNGTDDVEPITTARNGNLWFGSTDTYVSSGEDSTYSLTNLMKRFIHTEYGISHFRYEVKDKATGETVLCEYPYVITKHFTNRYNVSTILDQELLEPYADGAHTIHIYAYLATGEWHEVFYRTLTA